MSTLPRALATWDTALEPFARALHGPLRDMAQRLGVLVGPLGAASRAEELEPSGYQGLARRGSFDRLLPLEWMLASEIPQEFLRRAAQGEQAFFELGREGAPDPRGVVLLFDAGPESLGAPRIAQLALLVLFSRRAREAGIRLRWGVLQAATPGVFETVDEPRLRAFLAARSWSLATREHLGQWMALCEVADARERFVVGPRSLVELTRRLGCRALAIDDELTDGPRRLRLSTTGGALRAVSVEVPEGAIAARLLSEPWEAKVEHRALPATSGRRDARVSCVLHPRCELSVQGGHLLARGTHGELVAYSYMRGKEGVRRFVRALYDGERVVAFRHRKQRFTMLTERDGVLFLEGPRPHGMRTQLRLRQQGRHAPDAPDLPAIDTLLLDDGLLGDHVFHTPYLNVGLGASQTSVAFQVGARLALVDFGEHRTLASRVYHPVAFGGRNGTLHILEAVTRPDGTRVIAHHRYDEKGFEGIEEPGLPLHPMFLGASPHGGDVVAVVSETAPADVVWRVGRAHDQRRVVVPVDHTVCGAGTRGSVPGVVALDPTRRFLRFMGPDVPVTLCISPLPIEYVRVGTYDSHVVLRHADGLIRVLDLHHGNELLVVEPGEGA